MLRQFSFTGLLAGVITVKLVTKVVSSANPLRRNGFTFKQFFVAHDRCAMKVGTDGVLLGATAPVSHARRVLDIGCGSGLIAMMLAQRSNAQTVIDAVELEPSAAAQAEENFLNSVWAQRLAVYAQDINAYAGEHQAEYDLIVSNPPYFESAVACRDEARNAARYTETLTHDALLECANKLLTPEGLFSVVLPYDIGLAFETLAHRKGWFSARRMAVRDRPGKPLNRLVLTLSRQSVERVDEELALRKSEGVYSEAFCALITDFYLNY
ncbi:tRNA(1)(Val) (adenine(37)-N(6))-methyltransferase TrmN [Rahnella aceris]|uniref:tRNA(1)(Val) (adenine(37)-N(6))-methyltransferase TrmN n=1 Tax=Rahnella sp. (strain Y9602) TaxID=2703885 RepID=UPI0039BFCEF0